MKKFIQLSLAIALVFTFTIGTYLLAAHLADNSTAGGSCRVGWNSRYSCNAGYSIAGITFTERVGWNS